MITSRPDESDEMGGISFDRYVEIAGFSPQQVQEFVDKYFRESHTIKKVVLDHVMKNDIYSEAVNMFELKHYAASEYRTKEIPEKFNASHLVESTLDKLSELATKLLSQKKKLLREKR